MVERTDHKDTPSAQSPYSRRRKNATAASISSNSHPTHPLSHFLPCRLLKRPEAILRTLLGFRGRDR